MWSQLLLCLLVGLAFAQAVPAWKKNTEYTYHVQMRTLSSLHDISDKNKGIVIKANLNIRSGDGTEIHGKLFDVQYAEIEDSIKDWRQPLPSAIEYTALEFSKSPFQILMNESIINGLIVDKDIQTWELNIIKAVLSQFQLDTKGMNLINDNINILPSDEQNAGIYKTLEDTVSGIIETLYDVHPVSEHILESKPWLAPIGMRPNDKFIEVVKNKNHSRTFETLISESENTEGYFQEKGNQLRDFLSHSTVSRAILTGNLKNYIIQSSVTYDEIVVSPTFANQQKGSVRNMVNVTLLKLETQNDDYEVPNPVYINNLVYLHKQSSKDDNSACLLGRNSLQSYDMYRKYGPKQLPYSYDQRRDPEEFSNSLHLPYVALFHDIDMKYAKNNVEIVKHSCVEIDKSLRNPFVFLQKSELGRFIKIVKLIRTMNVKELERISSYLSGGGDDFEARQWKIFRDAVAQAGTAESLSCIQEWIKNGTVADHEAATLVFSLARATRRPSEDYIRIFVEMIQDSDIMEQSQLNETVLLSYTDLIYRAYVKTNTSNEIYVKEIIQLLEERLDKAILQDDKEKIHTYIIAIGNLGHPKILEIFKKYLNGNKQVSHVQRLLMVLALERLIENQPLVAQNVLYRIYQNAAENTLVRSAAVHLLVRTQPSASILQRMAQYTNEDDNEQVNAAVQTVIQTAADIRGEEYQYLRSAAKSALPYLTSKQYGIQDFKEQLLEFVGTELDQGFQKLATTFGSKDHFVPSGVLSNFEGKRSGMRNTYIKIQHIVSSIEDLVTVYLKQTKEYQDQLKDQQPQDQQWSSKQIAKKLGFEITENEQLEGMTYMHYPLFLMDYIVSFTNQTIENLPETIQKMEEEYRKGKLFDNFTMFNDHEYSIMLPTASGFLFTFNHNNPIVYQLKGKTTAKATPPMSTGTKLQDFQRLDFDISLNVLASGKAESRLAFIAPFTCNHYGFGYDRNVHFNFPLRINGSLDSENKQVRLEMKPLEATKQDNFLWVHLSSWPYLYTLDPVLLSETRTHLQQWKPQQYKTTFGLNDTGVAVQVHVRAHELPNLKEILLSLDNGLSSFFEHVNYWTNDRVQFADLSVRVDEKQTTTEKVNIELNYNHTFITTNQHPVKFSKHFPLAQNFPLSDNVEERIENVEKYLQKSGVLLFHTYVFDGAVNFTGDNTIKYLASGGIANSQVDANSAMLFLFHKHNVKQHKTYSMGLISWAHHPNTNGLDMDYAIEFNPTPSLNIFGVFGDDLLNLSSVSAKLEGRKTDERKEYLKNTPLYRECKEHRGNKQLPPCANMTVQANFLDYLNMSVIYDFKEDLMENIYTGYSLSKYFLNSYINESIYAPEYEKNKLYMDLHFNPNLTKVDGFLKVNRLQTHLKNVKLNTWAKQLLVPHPVFNAKIRLQGTLLGYDIYNPYCVVDQAAVSTFKQVVYPAVLLPQWTVMMLYVPSWAHDSSTDLMQQFDEQVSNYAVLAKQSSLSSDRKEIKITLQTPETNGTFVEILLKPPTRQELPEVVFNGTPINLSKRQAYSAFKGYIQIYLLPNNELKVELENDFYILYDGTRARLSIVNGKFRGSVRGICGAFEEPATDLQTPQGCIASRPHQLIMSYTYPKIQNTSPVEKCVRKKENYVKVVGKHDISPQSPTRRNLACTKHQTQYIKNGNEVCFTLRPVPVCREGCSPSHTVTKKVPVHCVKDSRVTSLLKKQIDNGRSPDFSNKVETAQLSLKLAQSCSE